MSQSSSGRASQHLAHLSEALRPARPPWYVRHPLAASLEDSFPADGWYWVPAGATIAEYIGRTAGVAEHRLRSRLEQAERDG